VQILTKTRAKRTVTPIALDYVERTFQRAQNGTGMGEIHQAIRAGWPVQLGVLSDPFPPKEHRTRNTYNFLKLLNGYDHPFQVLTKSDIILRSRYVKQLQEGNPQVIISIPSLCTNFSKGLEPNVPPPLERLRVIEKLLDEGIRCTLRIWPIIPGVNEDPTELLEVAYDVGVREVQAGYLHMYNHKDYIKRLNGGYDDIFQESKNKNIPLIRHGKYYYPHENHKLKILGGIRDKCNEIGINFYTPNSPSMNDWGCCCGPPPGGQYNRYSLKTRGYLLGEGVSIERYLEGEEDYIFRQDFSCKYKNGSFCKVFSDIKYNGEHYRRK